MRRRDIRVHLHDVATAAAAITTFIDGRSEAGYRDDLMLRSAVERQFEVLGEALSRALRVAPDLVAAVPATRGSIDQQERPPLGRRTAVRRITIRCGPRLREARRGAAACTCRTGAR